MKKIMTIGLCLIFLSLSGSVDKYDKYEKTRENLHKLGYTVYFNNDPIDIDTFDFDKLYTGFKVNNTTKEFRLDGYNSNSEEEVIIFLGYGLDVELEEVKEDN